MSVDGVEFESLALTSIARDLRTPLVRLRQLSFQLDNELMSGQQCSAQAMRRLQLTIDQALQMVTQLEQANGLLNVAAVPLEPIELNDLCSEINDDLQPLGSELHSQIVCQFPRRPLVVLANRLMLKTVLTNFLADAINYTRDDQPVDLRLRRSRCGRRALIKITDNGPGFDMTKSLRAMANVTPVKERPLMSSLNLIMADRLTRAMHGQLLVHNKRSCGVTIEACLPISNQLSLLGER